MFELVKVTIQADREIRDTPRVQVNSAGGADRRIAAGLAAEEARLSERGVRDALLVGDRRRQAHPRRWVRWLSATQFNTRDIASIIDCALTITWPFASRISQSGSGSQRGTPGGHWGPARSARLSRRPRAPPQFA